MNILRMVIITLLTGYTNMKLYATTTSDRKDAKSGHNISKGLGANEYLEIVLTDETKRKLVKLDIWIDKQNHTILKYEDCMGNQIYHDITLEKAEQKGKQKKGERIGGNDRQFKDWPVNGA